MAWSIPAGRIFGIRVRVHVALLIVCLAELIRAFDGFGLRGAWIGATFLGILYLTVLLHELGHCFAGAHFGGDPDEILLWPLGGLAFIDGVPRRAWPQIATALAGPGVNLLLAGGCAAALALGGKADAIPAALPFVRGGEYHYAWGWYFVTYALWTNAGLLLFNLLPAFPLDGGQALRWALVPGFGYPRATRIATTIGFTIAIVLGGVAIFTSWLVLALIAVFIWFQCLLERRALEADGGFLDADVFGHDFSQGYTSLDERPPRGPGPIRRWLERWRAKRREREMARELEIRRRVDELLVKIGEGGLSSLSDGEKAFLKDASKRYRA